MRLTFRPSAVFLLLSLFGASLLSAQPVAPTPAEITALHNLAYPAGVPRAAASATPFTVNTASREEVRQFYRSIYFVSEGTSMAWTGNYTASDAVTAAGDTSAAFKEATRVRINFFRALCGVPAAITFSAAYSAKNSQAALMMSANAALSHTPPNTWTYYTSDGALAASNSNLAYGSTGPDAISGYMADSGTNNAAVGHRRWLYYPQTLLMGTGDVAGNDTYYPANTTWVIDDQFGQARPATRTAFVSYPAAGYVPYTLVWPRWSFSYPNADFSAATVTMARNGSPIATALEALTAGAGENTLAWVYDGLPDSSGDAHPKPTADTVYTVTVGNVKIGGSPQNFTYSVIVFDPDTTGNDYVPTSVSLPATIPAGQATTYNVTAPTYASQTEFRPLQFSAYAKTYDAENGLNGLTPISAGGYPMVVTAPQPIGAGTSSYRLASPSSAVLNESLSLPETFYAANAGATLTFLSRLGYASNQQVAHVQIALDDGTGWFDLQSQTGTSPAQNATPTESSYSPATISLAAYAGRTFRLRFDFSYSGSGIRFNSNDPAVGWFLDNIAVNGVQLVTPGTSTVTASGASGTFTPAATGSIGVQARGLFFGTYPMEWGTVAPVTVVNGPIITAQPQSHVVAVGSTAVFSVTATSVNNAPLTYQWKKSSGDIPGATSSRLVLANLQVDDGAAYTVAVSDGTTTTISAVAGLAVVTTSDPGRLVNLSVRGYVGTGNQVLIMGFVTGGDGTFGTTSLLVRGVGPSIVPAPYSVPDALPDPVIALIPAGSASAIVGNDDWGGTADLKTAASNTGAFPLISDSSKDAALLYDFPRNLYSVVVSGNNGTTGPILAELYDANAPLPYNAATPRLINISARAYIGPSGNIIAGFVVAGQTAKTVLVRAIGPDPTFAASVSNANLSDPILYLHHAHDGTDDIIYINDNWGGDPQLTAVGTRVGAAPLTEPTSKDAAILITLDPGVYSAIDYGIGNATGISLVEVYDVP